MKPDRLFKTTIVIWSGFDTSKISIMQAALDATEGFAYCAKHECEDIQNPQQDPDWDGTEFFDKGDS